MADDICPMKNIRWKMAPENVLCPKKMLDKMSNANYSTKNAFRIFKNPKGKMTDDKFQPFFFKTLGTLYQAFFILYF